MIDYNKPSTWADAAIHTPPSFDVSGYQAKIDKIFGLSENGSPVVRLTWIPDISKTYSKFYTSWNGNIGMDSELRAKYKYATIAIPGTADIIDIPPPRWILEQYEHPGQYAEVWEQARWAKDGRELRPPAPLEGYYSELFKIVRHDASCCKNTPKQMVCWGSYRVPDDKDLAVLKRAKFKRDQDKEIDLTKPLTVETLDLLGKETRERQYKKQMETDEKMAEFVEENALALIEVFAGIKLSDKTKKFSLPSNYKKENGIIAAI